jgi:hypothetical protein
VTWSRVPDSDDLDDAERAALHDSVRESLEDAKAGRTTDAAEFVARLVARANSATRRRRTP